VSMEPRLDLWATDQGRELMADYLGAFLTYSGVVRTILAAMHGPITMNTYFDTTSRMTRDKMRVLNRLVLHGFMQRKGKQGNVVRRLGYHLIVIDEHVLSMLSEIVAIIRRQTESLLDDCLSYEADRMLDLQEWDLTDLKRNPNICQ